MGCSQSTAATSTRTGSVGGSVAKQQKKKHEIGSNLIVSKQKNFREDYNVVKRVGEGSISNIYKIQSKSGAEKGKIYALKEIDTSLVKPEFMAEMKNEIALMRSITHPNILKIYEVYDDKKTGHMGIVMELCSGGDLNKRSPYTEKEAKTMVAKLLEAVNYLHKNGVIHRDIKYENLMFENTSKQAEIKVIDFGLSAKYQKGGQHLTDKVGTVYTMSPQCLRGDYDSQADLWSIGVVTYQLLSGDKPFWGDSPKAIAHEVVKGEYNFDAPVWKQISPQAKDFVSKLIVVDPKVRYTAQQALGHPWVASVTKGSALKASTVTKVYKSLDSYRENPELKKLALQAIAHKTTTEETRKLRDTFHNIDKDHDGTITMNELKQALRTNYSEKDIDELFKNVDVDESGVIDYTEFLAATLEEHGSVEEDRIREAFQVFDSSNTGYITKDDLRKILGKRASPQYVESLISEADTNRDGKISFAEFKAVFKSKTEDEVAEIRAKATLAA